MQVIYNGGFKFSYTCPDEQNLTLGEEYKVTYKKIRGLHTLIKVKDANGKRLDGEFDASHFTDAAHRTHFIESLKTREKVKFTTINNCIYDYSGNFIFTCEQLINLAHENGWKLSFEKGEVSLH